MELPQVDLAKNKGVDKFLKRQKAAQEVRKEKELFARRDLANGWVRKATVPVEFSLSAVNLVFLKLNHSMSAARIQHGIARFLERSQDGITSQAPQKCSRPLQQ